MSKFVVDGGRILNGEVKIPGSKNAAFPVMAACILTEGICEIHNVPDIFDVRNFLDIMRFLGAHCTRTNHTLTIDSRRIKNRPIPKDLTSKLRGSIVMAGALLSRFGSVEIAYPGGDAIGRRPIDVHLDGFRSLGGEVEEANGTIRIKSQGLKGNRITLPVTSVTGTENLILAAVRAKGVTEILLAATEPHVQSLCRFLKHMGAKIEGIGTPNLQITGVSTLKAANFSLNCDEIDAITFCTAAALTHGDIRIEDVELKNLEAPLALLKRMKVNVEQGQDWVAIHPPKEPYQATKIVTGVFPQLLTDFQPLFGVLATQAQGETSIHDWIYEGRQGYLKALQQMGAKVSFDDVHRCRIVGPTTLLSAQIETNDIRAGASVLIAALIAKGQSVIYNAEIIDRGYEKLDARLNKLGASIKRID